MTRAFLLAVALLASGCGVTGMVADSDLASQIRSSQRAVIRALRANAGLTPDEYWAETTRLDPEYVRARGLAELRREAVKRGIRSPHDSRPVEAHEMPEDLRRRYDALPKGESTWGLDRLVYRAHRLAAGATEEQVVAELKAEDPGWSP
jgi:hypothetical protein